MSNLLKKMIPVLLVFGYGVYLVWLFFSRKILLFVQQDYASLSIVSGVFLLITATVQFFHILKNKNSAQHFQSESEHKMYSSLVLFIPLVLAIFIVPKPLSSATAFVRSEGVGSEAALTQPKAKVSMFEIDTTRRSIVDWIQLFIQDPEPERYKGLKVKLTGFVLQKPDLPQNHFMISRFVISCCAADARPVGIPVRFENIHNGAFIPSNDQWVEVMGAFDVEEILQERQPVVVAENIKLIPVPDNPYAN